MQFPKLNRPLFLQEVFGDNKWLWFVPVFTSFGDGVSYPQRNQLDEEAGLLEGTPPSGQSARDLGYPSEEYVPMMGGGSNDGWGEENSLVLTTSTSSSEQSGHASGNGNGLTGNGGVLAGHGDRVQDDLIGVRSTSAELVAVNM